MQNYSSGRTGGEHGESDVGSIGHNARHALRNFVPHVVCGSDDIRLEREVCEHLVHGHIQFVQGVALPRVRSRLRQKHGRAEEQLKDELAKHEEHRQPARTHAAV